jgi:hypothetical protein
MVMSAFDTIIYFFAHINPPFTLSCLCMKYFWVMDVSLFDSYGYF